MQTSLSLFADFWGYILHPFLPLPLRSFALRFFLPRDFRLSLFYQP